MKVFALKVRIKNHPFPLFSWLIMIFQGMNPFRKTSWSHNAVNFRIYNEEKVIHATSKGVEIVSFSEFISHYTLVGMKELPPPVSVDHFDRWTRKIEGRGYDFLQIFGLAAKMLGFITFNRYGSNFKRMVCSEVILNYLKEFHGYTFIDSDDFSLIDTWAMLPDYKEE